MCKIRSILAISIAVAVVMIGLCIPVSAALQASFIVDPINGNDNNNGLTVNTAWQTLEHARDYIRTIKGNMTGDIEVNLRGGDFYLNKTVIFTDQDSGNNGFRVIYQNYNNETPVINGGVKLTGGWTLDPDTGIYSIPYEGSFRQIYCNGIRGILARTPNWNGAEDLGPYYQDEQNVFSAFDPNNCTFNVAASEVSNWANISQVELATVEHWRNKIMRIAGYQVNGTRATISLQSPEKSCETTAPLPDCYEAHYYQNAKEFLDAENEWYYDSTAHMLYYKPRTGENPNVYHVTIPRVETLVEFQGASTQYCNSITFKGVTFCYSNWDRPNSVGYLSNQAAYYNRSDSYAKIPGAIKLSNASGICIDSCNIELTGAHGIYAYDVSKDNEFVNNTIHDTAAGGIYLDTDSELSTGNNIHLNEIYNGGMCYSDAVGIFIKLAPYSTVSHNEIYNYRYTAISTGWSWYDSPTTAQHHNISYNRIHHVMQLHDDGGAIYSVGRIDGMSIARNYIYGISKSNYSKGYSYGYPIAGIYLDNGSSYKTVSENVIENCPSGAFAAKNSPNHDNTFSNNYYKGTFGEVAGTNNLTDNFWVYDSWPRNALNLIKSAGIFYTASAKKYVKTNITASSDLNGWSPAIGDFICIRNGKMAEYQIKVNNPGDYNVKLKGGSSNSVYLKVGSEAGEWVDWRTSTGGYETVNELQFGTIYLQQGINTIKVENLSGDAIYFVSMELQKTDYLEIQKYGVDFMPGGEGVGYHDEPGQSSAEFGYNNQSGYATLCLRKNEWAKYNVNVPEAGTYNVFLNTAMPGDEWFVLDCLETGSNISKILGGTGGYDAYQEQSLGVITLKAGSNTIKLTKQYNPAYIGYLNFVKASNIKPVMNLFAGTDLISNKITSFRSGHLVAKANLNGTLVGKPVVLIVAVYKNNVVDKVYFDTSNNAQTDTVLKREFDVTDDGESEYKISTFLWDSINTQKSYAVRKTFTQ